MGYGSNLAGVAFLMKRKHVIDVVREMKWARKGLLDLGARLAQLLALLKNFEDEKHRLDRATALADDISLALSGVRDSAERVEAPHVALRKLLRLRQGHRHEVREDVLEEADLE